MRGAVVTAGGFTTLDARCIRFFHEISKAGWVHVLLLGDALLNRLLHRTPAFSESERRYFLESIRYVDAVHPVDDLSQLQQVEQCTGEPVDAWFTLDGENAGDFEAAARRQGVSHHVVTSDALTGYPGHSCDSPDGSKKKVVVTGCYDLFHSGHVRFFEEASEFGDLYVVVGHDKNIEALKGPGHPMFTEDERRYCAGAIRFVQKALISTGDGWLDAEPEIRRLAPDIYVVNEDGDKDVKKKYCKENGIEYIVLKREPKPGLKRRTSTDLRGF